MNDEYLVVKTTWDSLVCIYLDDKYVEEFAERQNVRSHLEIIEPALPRTVKMCICTADMIPELPLHILFVRTCGFEAAHANGWFAFVSDQSDDMTRIAQRMVLSGLPGVFVELEKGGT